MRDIWSVSVALSLVFGLFLSACDRTPLSTPPVTHVELAPPVQNKMLAPSRQEGREQEGMRPESLRVQGASLLFRLIRPQGLNVKDFVCLDDGSTPEHFLEIMACWHPSHGWLEPHQCSDESYVGQQARSLSRASTPGELPEVVTLGASMRVCEREVMKWGFISSGEQGVWKVPVWSTSPAPADPVCEVKRTSRDEHIVWSSMQLVQLGKVWGRFMSLERASACDALMFTSDGALSPWVLSELEASSGDRDVRVSDELVFPGARSGSIQALRSMVIEHKTCQVTVVWSRREESWEVLGLNESSSFSSTQPFGEGPLDVTTSVCSDLNEDGSPELWFSSGYETMGGELLVDLSGVKPVWLFSRYTGD